MATTFTHVLVLDFDGTVCLGDDPVLAYARLLDEALEANQRRHDAAGAGGDGTAEADGLVAATVRRFVSGPAAADATGEKPTEDEPATADATAAVPFAAVPAAAVPTGGGARTDSAATPSSSAGTTRGKATPGGTVATPGEIAATPRGTAATPGRTAATPLGAGVAASQLQPSVAYARQPGPGSVADARQPGPGSVDEALQLVAGSVDGYAASGRLAAALGATREQLSTAYEGSRAELASGSIQTWAPDGLAGVLRSLPETTQIVLVTNAPETGVIQQLEHLGLADAFNEIVTSAGKPAGMGPILARLLQQNDLEANPANLLSVGDIWRNDLAPAAALGCETALIERLPGPADAHPTYRAPAIEQLYAAITAWAAR